MTLTHLKEFDLELVAWDRVLDNSASALLLDNFDKGYLHLPSECPIEPNSIMGGPVFGPLLVDESPHRLRFAGVGNLCVKGIALAEEPSRLVQHLSACVGKHHVPLVLIQLVERLAAETGLERFFKDRRRIGIAEHVFRLDDRQDGSSLLVYGDTADTQMGRSLRGIKIRRNDLAVGQHLRLHIMLRNFDDTLEDRIAEMPDGVAEITVSASDHVTDVEIVAFDERGQRVERICGSFCQGVDLRVGVQGQSDQLPPAFPGSPDSPDLETRPRLLTIRVTGDSSADNRPGVLDVLRKNTFSINQLVGEPHWKGESRWFDAGIDNQIEVIRWIKTKLESPLVGKAMLIDPFLGTEALHRVIVRQGNESIDLTILVSPGNTNPDAEQPDAHDTKNNEHISRLVALATEWSNQLCGSIKIINIRRGDGKRQAFHDRYLVLIDKADVPYVFLLSNSLSKAAGSWPFGISEVDRPISWRIRGYIQHLVEGTDTARDLTPELVWESPKKSTSSAPPSVIQAANRNTGSDWLESLGLFCGDLWRALLSAPNRRDDVIAATNSFMSQWPKDIDVSRSADTVFESLGHRPEVVVWIAACLEHGSTEQLQMALHLDRQLLRQFVVNLQLGGTGPSGYLKPLMARDEYFSRLAMILCREGHPTNYVRAKLNPALFAFVQTIEMQRGDFGHGYYALTSGICILILGLNVALNSSNSFPAHRVGVAVDYTHWFGRLARSEVANNLSVAHPSLIGDMEFAVASILKASETFGASVEEAIARVVNDPLVSSGIKITLRGSPQR